MTDDSTKSEPASTLITLFLDMESDGRLTIVTSGEDHKNGWPADLRLSGDPATVFRDLGPEIARLLLAKKDTPSFETLLRQWMKDDA